MPLVGDKNPIEVARTPFAEVNGRSLPGGRWVAYQSNEMGYHEIYVQPFPGPGAKKQITSGGGTLLALLDWSQNGRELHCNSSDVLVAR